MNKKINDLVIKQFKNKNLNSLIWEGKICWFGMEITEFFGYSGRGKAVYDCIKAERLQEGREYKILVGEELKKFKEVFSDVLEDIRFAPKVVILYESGLYRFLAYTKMPLGIEFREWIGTDLMPTLREKGYYMMEGANISTKSIEKREYIHNDSSYLRFNTEQMERYRMALETAKFFESRIDKITEDPVYKFLFFKQIFLNAGLELPKFIEEELMGSFNFH